MKKRFWVCAGALAIILCLTACGGQSIMLLDGTEYDGESDVSTVTESTYAGEIPAEPTSALIQVHICGAVLNPGVYILEEGSRVHQAVELAGGFLPEAAKSYLNLAEILADGQKLVVPTAEEAAEDLYGLVEEADNVDNGLVNINTADKERLMTLPGIGEARALAIIAWRTEHGAFQTTEDIMQVSGIKEAAYEKIKSLITVG